MECYILAGGRSARMGEEKGLVSFKNQPLIQNVIENIPNHLRVSIISSDGRYLKFAPIVSDVLPNQGPLGGIYTALCTTQEKEVVVVPCDMPLIEASVWEKLTKQTGNAILHYQNEMQFFPLKVRIEEKEMLRERIEAGHLRVSEWLRELSAQKVALTNKEVQSLQSFNTKESIELFV